MDVGGLGLDLVDRTQIDAAAGPGDAIDRPVSARADRSTPGPVRSSTESDVNEPARRVAAGRPARQAGLR